MLHFCEAPAIHSCTAAPALESGCCHNFQQALCQSRSALGIETVAEDVIEVVYFGETNGVSQAAALRFNAAGCAALFVASVSENDIGFSLSGRALLQRH